MSVAVTVAITAVPKPLDHVPDKGRRDTSNPGLSDLEVSAHGH